MPKTNRLGSPNATASTSETPAVNSAEENIDRAVERIYRIYGPDLSVFFRAVQGHLNLGKSEDAAPTKTRHLGS
jgi:hypothetical protein